MPVGVKLSWNYHSEIVVPTTDSVRTTYLLDLLAPRGQHVLLCGPTGTGKTINISQYLMGQVRPFILQ
jgi:dynein heavy chain, axonemal